MYRHKKKSFIRMHFTTAFLVLLFFLSVPALVSYFYNVYVFKPQQKKYRRNLDNMQSRIIDDLRFLTKNPVFVKQKYVSNAHSLLQDKMVWSGHEPSLYASGYLRFLEITKFKNTDFKQIKRIDLEEFLRSYTLHMGGVEKLAWLPQLYEFNHWSYVNQKIYSDVLWNVTQLGGIERLATLARLPVPSFHYLRDFAVLYFIQKHSEGDPLEGLRLFRHVANLIQTSGSLVAQVSAVQMLKIEKHLVEEYSIQNWPVMSDESIEAYERVSLAWIGVMQLAYSKKKLDEFRPYMSAANGVCTSVHEMPITLVGLSEFLEPRWPFEMKILALQKEKYLEMIHLQAECNAEEFSVFFEPIPEGEWYVSKASLRIAERDIANTSSVSDHYMTWNRARIPYVRQIYGMMLANIVMPNTFKFYEQ